MTDSNRDKGSFNHCIKLTETIEYYTNGQKKITTFYFDENITVVSYAFGSDYKLYIHLPERGLQLREFEQFVAVMLEHIAWLREKKAAVTNAETAV